MTNVISICQPSKIFSVYEIEELIPLIQRITAKHEGLISKLLEKQRYLVQTGAKAEIYNALDPLVGRQMIEWGQKITKLGGKVLTHGYVAFDGGGFYYSWHYNETKIEFYHLYNESPLERKPIKVEPYVPQ